MKRLIMVYILIILSDCNYSQNLQIHYDFGDNRKYITTTLEFYNPDEYGSTYTFVDFDFNSESSRNISLAYWEIARYINFPFMHKFSATIQYNDGILRVRNSGIAVPLGYVWLFGISYPFDLKFITINTDLLYRSANGSDTPDFQVTFAWSKFLINRKFLISGFFDIWTQNLPNQSEKFVFLTEPQIWFLFTKHISAGSEIEISKNFIPGSDKIELMPTIAFRWNF